jgi:hypothetical protein
VRDSTILIVAGAGLAAVVLLNKQQQPQSITVNVPSSDRGGAGSSDPLVAAANGLIHVGAAIFGL